MEATTKFSNFSIDRIMGSGFGQSPPRAPIHTVGYIPGGSFHGLSRGQGCLDYSNVGRVSVPMPPAAPMRRAASEPYHGMDFGFGYDSYPTYGAYGLHHAGFSLYPNSVHTLHSRPADFPMNTGRQPLSCLDNCSYQQQQQQQQQEHASERPQPRPTSRMRTVFTESQTKHLDRLFEVTDYPGVETRAELARDAGLTEETVRVWFKNRRARRKKKHCSRVDTSPYSRPSFASMDTGLH